MSKFKIENNKIYSTSTLCEKTDIFEIVEKIPEIIDNIVDAFIDNLPLIVEAGIKLFVALVENLPAIITAIVKAIPEIITSIVGGFARSIPQIISAGVELFVSLIQNLPTIIIEIVKAIPEIISGIVGGFIGAIPEIISGGVELFSSLIGNIPQIISNIIGAIPEIISGIVGSIAGFGGKFIEAGANLLGGLGKGIANAAGGVIKGAIGVGKKILGGIKGFFGIKSPSREFMKIGMQLDQGLAKGINDNVKPVTKAMDTLGDLTNQSFESQLSMSTVGGINPIQSTLRYSIEETDKAKQPVILKLVMANREFETFVEDITDIQDKNLNLKLSY